MNTVVLLRMVPDVVEELEVAEGGTSLDTEFLRLIINERDAHALEEALLLKERFGGTVTVVGLDAPEMDDGLFTGLAKGADRAVKIVGCEPGLSTRAVARVMVKSLAQIDDLGNVDLFLTGCQAIDDLDGMVAPLLAHALQLPYVGLISNVKVDSGGRLLTVLKEFPGGVHGEYVAPLPAMLGIQAAEKPPRYVPVAKVRAAMKSRSIEEVQAVDAQDGGLPALEVLRMAKPEIDSQAEMLEGSAEDVASRLGEILSERGLV